MTSSSPLTVWDRHQQRLLTEQVPMERAMRFLHGTRSGRLLSALWFARPHASRTYARLRATGPATTRDIAPFIQKYAIDMEEFRTPAGGFQSFDDFFVRQFREGIRPFTQDPNLLASPVEGRVSAWRTLEEVRDFCVKQQHLSPEAVLADAALARQFQGGPLMLLRLAPQDYHRFHYPDDARLLSQRHVPGWLYSVHPIAMALRGGGDAMCANERHVTVMQTAHFGALAMVEVGAITVGRIVQHHDAGDEVRRGEEKGMFRYGGSSLVLFGERGAWTPDEEMLERTRRGVETLVRLGTPIGHRDNKTKS